MSGKTTGEEDPPRVEGSPRLRSPFGGSAPAGGSPGSLFVPASETLDVDAAAASDAASSSAGEQPLPPPVPDTPGSQRPPARPAQDGPTQTSPAQTSSAQTRPAQIRPVGGRPGQVRPAAPPSRPGGWSSPASAPAADATSPAWPAVNRFAPPAEGADESTSPAPEDATSVANSAVVIPADGPADAPQTEATPADAAPTTTAPGEEAPTPSSSAVPTDAPRSVAVPTDAPRGAAMPTEAARGGAVPSAAGRGETDSSPDASAGAPTHVATPAVRAEQAEPAVRAEQAAPAEPAAVPDEGFAALFARAEAARAAGIASRADAPEAPSGEAPAAAPEGTAPSTGAAPGTAAEAGSFTGFLDPVPPSEETTVPVSSPAGSAAPWATSVPPTTSPEAQAPGWGGGGGDRYGYDDEPSRSGGAGKKVLIGAGVLGALLVVGYGGVAYATSGSIPRGTSVGGVDIGSMRKDEAVAALTAAEQSVPAQINVTAGSRGAQLDRQEAGLTLDATGVVDGLTGLSFAPKDVWHHLAGGDAEVAGQGEGAVAAALAKLSGKLDVEAQNAGVLFNGQQPTITAEQEGETVDREAAAALLSRTWLTVGKNAVALPVVTSKPTVTQAEADSAIDSLATPALAEPLKVTVEGKSASVSPEALAPALRLEAADGKLALAVDGPTLRTAVLAAAPGIETKAKDAGFELVGGKPKVVPSVPGVTVDPAALAKAAAEALNAGKHELTVATAPEQPELTSEKAAQLGVQERVSTFSTNLTSNAGRTDNLRIAARTVNGTVVMPGETFSLNAVLGERTAAKGYNAAPAISGGRLVQDYGGGVSQMATTIFNNVFFSGLQDVYHKPHSFYISRYPEGREATVDWPTVDLKWKNDSPYAVLIQANVTKTVNVSFWSTKVYDVEATKSSRSNYRTPSTVYDDSPGCVKQDANPGFDVVVGRIIKKDGAVVKRESFKAVYNAEDKIICEAKPAEKKDTGTTPPPPD